MRDNDGSEWSFEESGYQGITPSHLPEHMLRGLPVTVEFHTEGDARMIDDITD